MKLLRMVILILFLTMPVIANTHTPYFFLTTGGVFPHQETIIPRLNKFTVRTDTNQGLLLGGGIGFKFRDNIKMELEMNHGWMNISDLSTVEMRVLGIKIEGGEGSLNSLSLTANGRYNFPSGRKWTPYILGGAGAGQISLKDVVIHIAPVYPDASVEKYPFVDDKTWQFVYQAGFGLTYLVGENFILDLGYRYFAALNPSFHTVHEEEFKGKLQRSHLLLSLKYRFK